MTELKPYKKEKEGKLQRLPVRHTNSYSVHNEEQDFIILNPKTKVIVHHGKLDQRPLEMIKSATMQTNPFLIAMQKKYEEENKQE